VESEATYCKQPERIERKLTGDNLVPSRLPGAKKKATARTVACETRTTLSCGFRRHGQHDHMQLRVVPECIDLP
jgi:hypothetical protein